MCMKKPKPKQPKFEIIYNPYHLNDDDDFDIELKRYMIRTVSHLMINLI